MNFTKYFAFLAILVLCLLGQHATEAGFLGKFGKRLDGDLKKGAKDAETDAKDVVKVVEVAGAVGTVVKVAEIGDELL